MNNYVSGTQKLEEFYDKHPLRTLYAGVVLLGLSVMISLIIMGQVFIGLILIGMQIPWVYETSQLFNEHMESYDEN